MEARLFIPAHAEPVADIRDLVRINVDATDAAADRIESLCGDGTSFDALLRGVFRTYGLQMTFGQHTLVGSTVRGYLTYLENCGRVRHECEDDLLLWRKA